MLPAGTLAASDSNMSLANAYAPPRRCGGLAILLSGLLLLAIPSASADFVDPFATVCSKQAETWHQLEIEAGRAIKACSDEYKPDEPSLCGYIGRDGNCTLQGDCEDGGVAKVECPAGSSRSGGCCLIPKIFDCGGPNGTCITTNGGPECQNTCEEIPMPPAPAPAPAPMEPPLEAPAPAPVAAPAPAPAPPPAPEPTAVLLPPPPPPADEPAVGPSEVLPAANATAPPVAAAIGIIAPAPAPADAGPEAAFGIGTRDFSLAPVEAAPESAEDDAGGAAAASAGFWPAAVACSSAAVALAIL